MTEITRQRRRHAIREQVKLGRGLMSSGLPPEPRRVQVMGVARVLFQKLDERVNIRRAGEAARLAQSLAEASLKARPPKLEIACRVGCAFCCHGFVGVSAPEVFLIASTLRGRQDAEALTASIATRAGDVRDLTPDARIGRKLACALLIDDQCSVYAERPLVCRQTTSLSKPACIDEFEGRDRDGRIEVSSLHLAHASNAHVALLGAMRAAGLPTVAFELSSALALALADRESESRWLSGEDVFRELPRHVRRPPEVEAVAEQIAAELRSPGA